MQYGSLNTNGLGTTVTTNSTAVITGSGTLWSTSPLVVAGNLFTIDGNNYEIGSIDSETQLTLTSIFAGADDSGQVYVVSSAFTANHGLAYTERGDVETAALNKRTISDIDTLLKNINSDGDITGVSIDDSPIGVTTPSSGSFTEFNAEDIVIDAVSTNFPGLGTVVAAGNIYEPFSGSNWPLKMGDKGWYSTNGKPTERLIPIAETSYLYIFDLTESIPVLWDSFDFTGLTITDVNMLSGAVQVTTTTGIVILDLLTDELTVEIKYSTSTTPAIINNSCNKIAVTQLDNAPVDVYGVKASTALTGTGGGSSFIKDDDTVVDVTSAAMISVDIQSGGRNVMASTSDVYIFNEVPASDTTTASADFTLNSSSTPAIDGVITSVKWSGDELIIGTSTGVFTLTYNQTAPAESMIRKKTDEFDTGIQPGAIAGCWLADTDDTDVTGSELVTNGEDWTGATGSTPPNGWTSDGTTQFTISSGQLVVDRNSGTGVATQSLTTIVGKTYTVILDLTAVTATPGDTFTLVVGVVSAITTDTLGTHTYTFVATDTSTNFQIFASGALNAGFTIDYIRARIANPDRSVNSNALQQFGTDTRTASGNVGKSIVWHSYGSSIDYQEQPFNADMSNGTGAMDRLIWLKQAANSAIETILERDSSTSAQRYTLQVNADGTVSWIVDDATTTRTATSTITVDDASEGLFLLRYDGAGGIYIYRNGNSTPIASATGAALLTLDNPLAVLRHGLSVAGTNTAVNAKVLGSRMLHGNISMAQFKWIYDQEKPLVVNGADCVLQGSDVAIDSMAIDPYTGYLHVIAGGYYHVISKSGVIISYEATTATIVEASDGEVIKL